MTELGQQPLDIGAPEPDDLILWSVTTIIGALEKQALYYWTAEQTAIAAIDEQRTWRAMLEDRGRAETIKWLRDARFRRPKDLLSAADLGTVTHTVCEEYALSGTRPTRDRIDHLVRDKGGPQVDIHGETAVVETMLKQFDNWLERFTPSYQATEVMVASPTYGYAGTADGFLTIDGVRAIIDYKTSREPYDGKGNPKTPFPEVSPQLAAYRWAEFAAVWRPRRTEKFRRRYYLLNATERAMAVPVPEVDGGLCIHITPESCDAFPVRCDRQIHEQFLFILEAARWAFETAKTVIGQPLTPAGDH